MRIAVINPNSTVSMTDKAAQAARNAARAESVIDARTCHSGPPAIQGPEDGALAEPHVLAEIAAAEASGADAAIIACFDDTGLIPARQMARRPVVGIGEAGFHAAMLLAPRFSVVTTLSVSVPVIEENIARYGLGAACARVRASEVPVLELEREGTDARDRISAGGRASSQGRRRGRHSAWLRGHGGSCALARTGASSADG